MVGVRLHSIPTTTILATTKAIANNLFLVHPITRVVFTDFFPTPGSGGYWYLEGATETLELWPDLEELVWDSEDGAALALSNRAVKRGRELAGLQPLTQGTA